MKAFHIPTLIARKRDGAELAREEIEAMIAGFTAGEVPDAQMSAFAMAVYFQGMTARETAYLTYAMLTSGDTFSHRNPHPPIVDKHSTGGIGDKVSLVLAPLVACCGCWIPMVSGRGLGITGGTLDKLESIPGFQVRLSMEQAQAQLENIGVVMMGQTEKFCPADKKLYALRDVTGTVPSIPLITASIMSKKLAEKLDRLVLDVKYGSGAFMKTREQAIVLAEAMKSVGEEMGVEMHYELNAMDEPLGHAVGNVLEVIECIELMSGNGQPDLLALILSQAEKITRVSQDKLLEKITSGQVMKMFESIVSAQGGDVNTLRSLAKIHQAKVIQNFTATHGGTVISVDAGMIGQASLELGAGRAKAEDSIDPTVGFDRLVKVGQHISAGDTLCRIHAASASLAAQAQEVLSRAIQVK